MFSADSKIHSFMEKNQPSEKNNNTIVKGEILNESKAERPEISL